MEFTTEQLADIREALSEARDYLYNDLDAICDDEYLEQTEATIARLNKAISIIDAAKSE